MAIMDRVRRGEHDLSGIDEPLGQVLRESLSPDPLERPSVHELRASIVASVNRPTPWRSRSASPAPELWTMPFVPAPTPETARTEQAPRRDRGAVRAEPAAGGAAR